MSDPFKEFVAQMARLVVPEDDTEDNRERRAAAASESGTPIGELDESDIVACADDEFLCSEALALWAMIRLEGYQARQGRLVKRRRELHQRCHRRRPNEIGPHVDTTPKATKAALRRPFRIRLTREI
jgi:hypothetical protein